MKVRDKQELAAVISCNEKTERFGLVLSEEKAGELVPVSYTHLEAAISSNVIFWPKLV